MNQREVKSKPKTAVFEFVSCSVLSTVIRHFTSFVVSSFVFFLSLTSFVSVIFEMCGFFVLPKHPLGLACMPKPKDACNMLYKSAKTDRIFLFFFPRRALEAFEDHQSCQLQTQINYNLEDDPIRLTSTVCFCSSIYVCAHLLSSTV